jgi:hypothetical protein
VTDEQTRRDALKEERERNARIAREEAARVAKQRELDRKAQERKQGK